MQEKRISHEEIARIAYLLWEEEGRPQGRAKDHWLRAEAVLREKWKVSAKPGSALEKRRKPPRKKSATAQLSVEEADFSKSVAQKAGSRKKAAPKKSRRKPALAPKGKRKSPRTGRRRKSSSA